MNQNIYQEEYTREQARLAARKDAEPKNQTKAKKTSLVKSAHWLALLVLIVFAVLQLGSIVGLKPTVFLDRNFLFPALGLTVGFLWFLVR